MRIERNDAKRNAMIARTKYGKPEFGRANVVNEFAKKHIIQSRRRPVTLKAENKPPQKQVRTGTPEKPNLLLDAPALGTHLSIEYPTPDWFIIPLYKSQKVVLELIDSWDFEDDTVEAIFVDDCCPRNSKDIVVKAFENHRSKIKKGVGRIIYNSQNKGFGGTSNTGADHAQGDYIIYLNADTRVTPGWVRPIVDLFKSDPNIGIIGNLQLKDGGNLHDTIDSAGSQWSWRHLSFLHIGRHILDHQELGRPFNYTNSPPSLLFPAEREMVTGCCLAIPADLNRYVGGFNPNYRIGYWEDTDLCLTVRELGKKIMYQPHSVIYHKLGHTNSGAHDYADFNWNYFMNRWVRSGRIDQFIEEKRDFIPDVKGILLCRKGANGDVLVAAQVASALKKRYPQAKISFLTDCPEIIQHNPYIHKVFTNRNEISERQYELIYNLDMTYEHRPYVNLLASYCELVGVRKEDCTLFVHSEEVNLPKDYIVVHADRTAWAGRDWELSRFSELCQRLIDSGRNVVLVGRQKQTLPCTIDLRGDTSIAQMAGAIKGAKLFVGIDSMPMHLAQCLGTKGLSFFGSINPDTRIYSDSMSSITASDLPCLGCHHRKSRPCVVTNVCETQKLECISQVSVEAMWNKVIALV